MARRARRKATDPPQAEWKPARIVGVDGAWVNGKGMMVAVDLGEGELLALAEIDEKEKSAVAAWLKALKQQHNIGATVTDDLATYKEIARELELGHQIFQFHVRRWVGKALKTLEQELLPEWLPVILRLQDLIDELPVPAMGARFYMNSGRRYLAGQPCPTKNAHPWKSCVSWYCA